MGKAGRLKQVKMREKTLSLGMQDPGESKLSVATTIGDWAHTGDLYLRVAMVTHLRLSKHYPNSLPTTL